jgi:hypothetical protein
VDCTDAFDTSDVTDPSALVAVWMHVCPSCGEAWVIRRIEAPPAADGRGAPRQARQERVDLGERAVARIHAAARTRSLDLLGLRDLDGRSQTLSGAGRGGHVRRVGS